MTKKNALSFLLCLMATLGLYAKEKPNVIVILTDDQGTLDLGCYGAKDLKTPHLDALAKRGVRFSQFYAGSSVCSPSRASLLTGRTPQRALLKGNVPRVGRGGLPPEQVTMPEMLKTAGYKTALIGKWHLGEHKDYSPNAQGFDYFFGHKVGCIDNYSHFFYWDGPQNHDLWQNEEHVYRDGQYFPDLCVEETNKFISENKENPFFIYLALNTPHYPMQAEQKFVQMYKDLAEPRRSYAAFVSSLDDKVGQVLNHLKATGLEKETIVIFQSDHGYSTESRCGNGGGFAGDFRGNKFNLFEGGMRVPAIISWPGKFPENQVRKQFLVSADLFPTLAQICGAEEQKQKLDGVDIKEIIMNDDAAEVRETYVWQLGGSWAVRKAKWKLVRRHNGEFVLSDLAKDHRELKDLSPQYPEQRKALEDLYKQWLKTAEEQK